MKIKIMLLIFVNLINITAKSQLIDKYGIEIGINQSNQYWNYKKLSSLSNWQGNKIGIVGNLFLEKNVNNYLYLKSSFGYIQKGYYNDIKITPINGEDIHIKDNNVYFQNMLMDLSLKLQPFKLNINPYFLIGIRSDYLFKYKGAIIVYNGEEQEIDRDLYDKYNKFNVGGIIGVGFTIRKTFSIEFIYNPNITKNYNSDFISIKERCFSLTLGLNISNFIRKEE